MQLLGHKDIRMTMRYVEGAVQLDLQREFYAARQNAAQPRGAWIDACPPSTRDAIASPQPKNEERLAG